MTPATRTPPSPFRHALARVSRLSLAATVAGLIVGVTTPALAQPRPDAPTLAWQRYRDTYIDRAGFVLDRTRGEVTSEGQSYALLQAAWTGDARAFRRVYAWTNAHLRRRDGLYSWQWSPRDGGTIVDANSATDADQDIAFALILAADRFRTPAYRAHARTLIRAIRRHTRIDLPGGWLPAAGNWAVGERIVNLSYFAPYQYAYFDRLDPEGRWLEVRAAGYALVRRTERWATLPPDFMAVDTNGAPALLPDASRLRQSFSFDAIRILWRLELDCRLRPSADTCDVSPWPSAVADRLAQSGRLVSNYASRGDALTDAESTSFYACLLPWLQRRAPDRAAAMRRTHLAESTLAAVIDQPNRYYDANWTWFGLALTDGWLVARTPAVTRVPAAQRSRR